MFVVKTKPVDTYGEVLESAIKWLEYLGETGVADLPLPPTGEVRTLRRLRERIALCRRCSLGGERSNPVAGAGGPNARLVFICGTPAAGEEGALLERLIRAMGLEWSDAYITSIVRCRPHDGRSVGPEEVRRCLGYLEEEIDVISPVVVVALGDEAAEALLGRRAGVTLRGRFHPYRSTLLLATHDPVALLKKPALKRETWEDMKRVMELLSGETDG